MPHALTYLGIVNLIYSAYMAAQAPSSNIPLNIIVQVLLSMLATMAGLVVNAKFIDIKYTGHKNYETIVNKPGLYTFNHRGRVIYPRTASL